MTALNKKITQHDVEKYLGYSKDRLSGMKKEATDEKDKFTPYFLGSISHMAGLTIEHFKRMLDHKGIKIKKSDLAKLGGYTQYVNFSLRQAEIDSKTDEELKVAYLRKEVILLGAYALACGFKTQDDMKTFANFFCGDLVISCED